MKKTKSKPINTQLCILVDFKQIILAVGHGFPDLIKYIK